MRTARPLHPNGRALAAALLLAWIVALLAALPSSTDARGIPLISADDPANSAGKLAAPQTGETKCVYWEDFLEGDGGWVPRDLMTPLAYWHWEEYGGGGVMWCGTNDGLVTPPGYGNDWVQYLTKSFTLPSPSPTISYRLQYDVELDYDYFYLEVSTDEGESYTVLETWSGDSGGFVTGSTSLSPYAGFSVVIRFRFVSDNSYSDEDNFDSDGAARLDYVTVSGSDTDHFSSDSDGWVASAPEPRDSFRLEPTPACAGLYPCDDYCFSWVAYDPVSGIFPAEAPDSPIYFAVESPAITIPTDATQYLLKFDVYRYLPADGKVFYSMEIAAPPPEQGGVWQSSGFLYYGVVGFYTHTWDITSRIPGQTTQIKVRLTALDWCTEQGEPCSPHTPAPIFDNVAVYAIDTADPGVDDSDFPRMCAADADSDAVLDTVDLCVGENASPFDSNGDGCLDDGMSARHVEYWDRDAFPLACKAHNQGAPGISDGSDFTVMRDAFVSWTGIGGIEASVSGVMEVAQKDANALDRINLITFEDPDYQFGAGTIAVGLTSSFTQPAWFGNKWCRPGEIVDSDLIFNPTLSYRTDTQGPPDGIYLEAVLAHEIGHFFGLAHAAAKSSTMYFVLPPGAGAASLATDDSLQMIKAYGSPATMAAANRLKGTVTNGYTSEPLPGAAVFLIAVAGGDTLGVEYTLPDGSYEFVGLPAGDYYVGIHAIDGTSGVGFLQPAYINDYVANMSLAPFVPEFWDSSESAHDNAGDHSMITVLTGFPDPVADITTNIDDVPPAIVETVPEANATEVAIDAAILISFSERMNTSTLQGNFSLTDTTTHAFVPGNAAFLMEDSLVAFVPMAELAFASTYELKIETGFEDAFGNGLVEDFAMLFTTELEPDVALASLSPSKGVAGMIVALNGKGFDPTPANNTVRFNGTVAEIRQASATQIVALVPGDATSGAVNVYNAVQGKTSNSLQFTVLAPDEVPRGLESGICVLNATPRALTVMPDGGYAFVATDAGASAVVSDPGSGDYMTATHIPIAGGLTGIDAGPASHRVYAVSSATGKFYRLNATPGSMGLLSEKPIGATPRGILVHPAGDRAYIPTDDGEIQIWDIDEQSASFETPIGIIAGVDPSVRGELATTPAGDALLAVTGTGNMQIASLDSNVVTNTVGVGVYPKDIAVDAITERAYACDETGFLSVATLSGASLWKVKTGGTLYGVSLTPGGSFALVVNRELDLLSAIDLRETSPSFLSVVTTVALPENPTAIETSPDGGYAFTISEAENKLVATAVAVGPSLRSLSRRAGPEGTALVLAGSGFTADDGAKVLFSGMGGVWTAPDRLSDIVLMVQVPAGAASGPVRAATFDQGDPHLESNDLRFDILGATEDEMLRVAAALPGTSAPASDGGSVLRPSPGCDYLAVGDQSEGLHALVVDDASPQYHTYAGALSLGSDASDVAFAPDGRRAFVVLPDSNDVLVIGADRLQSDFLVPLHTVDFSGIDGAAIAKAAASPDGTLLLVSDPGAALVHCVDIAEDSPTEYQIVGSVDVSGTLGNGHVASMAFHPGGGFAYLGVADPQYPEVAVLNTDPESPQYLGLGNDVDLYGAMPAQAPVSLSFTPDGGRCLVLTRRLAGDPMRAVVMLDSDDAEAPFVATSRPLGFITSPADEHIEVSPRGDRAIADIHATGLVNLALLTSPDSLMVIQQTGTAYQHQTTVGIAYSSDASAFYRLSESVDVLTVYDFSSAQVIAIESGNGQSGVVNQPLAQPLRAKVTGALSEPVAGVPVTFTVTMGGGRFAAADTTQQVVATDAAGIAEVEWTLGPDLGVGAHTVAAVAPGLTGSPRTFLADGIADPETLPLAVTNVVPDSGATAVSIASAVQVIFSRPVDVATVTPSTFYLHDGDFNALDSAVGFSDANRGVSLSPQTALDPNTTYWIQVTTGVEDEAGDSLATAVVSSFTTEAPPAIELGSVAPVSAQVGDRVVLSGDGFNKQASLNTVLFGSLSAYVSAGSTDFLSVTIPNGATTGTVQVINTSPADTSNAMAFSVMPAEVTYQNDVVGTVSTSSATRSVSISPDGAFAFGVSPDANSLSVIDLRNLTYLTSTPVGENPVAVTVAPKGDFAYVANHVDGTVSVIDADDGSPTFCDVVDVFPVGVGPTDLVVTPDGDQLIVANYGSGTVSVVDADATSETYHSVLSTVATGSGSRTVAITPDGGQIYVGTDSGYLIISATDHSVVATIGTGSGTRTVAITPDGGLLIILTTDGYVDIYDIREGSPWQNSVVARVATDCGTTTVAISPDGGLLYLIQDVGDEILVGVLSIYGRFGAFQEGEEPPPYGVSVAIADTLEVGEDPADIAFDPTGSGKVIVTTAGDLKLTLLGESLVGTDVPEIPQAILGFPNPFSRSITIRFAVAERKHVRLAVYDVTGRLVRVLVDDNLGPSTYNVAWDGTDDGRRRVASGIYFWKIEAEGLATSRKMLLLK